MNEFPRQRVSTTTHVSKPSLSYNDSGQSMSRQKTTWKRTPKRYIALLLVVTCLLYLDAVHTMGLTEEVSRLMMMKYIRRTPDNALVYRHPQHHKQQHDSFSCEDTAVIGLAKGPKYNLPAFATFLYPLRRHYCGQIILFTDPKYIDEDITKLFNELKVTNMPVPDNMAKYLRPSEYRLVFYKQACVEPLKWCLLTDVRDAFFQADWTEYLPGAPKALDDDKGLEAIFAQESKAGGATIGVCPYNTSWLFVCHGLWTSKFFGKVAICSGTMFATPRATTILMDKMLEAAVACRNLGIDQGYLEWMLFNGELDGILKYSIQERRRGIANTIGYVTWILDETNAEGRITMLDGKTPSPIVHQYDRHEQLYGFVSRLVKEAKNALQR